MWCRRCFFRAAISAASRCTARSTTWRCRARGRCIFPPVSFSRKAFRSPISGERARPGDKILVSGMLGDHGVAVMSLRENLTFHTSIQSDTAALHGLVAAMVAAVPDIRVLRDPTRGGLATTLNEIARQSAVGMMLHENKLPIREQVKAACEFLGLDPLYVANEGKLAAICAPEDVERLLQAMRAHPLGCDAAMVGEVIEDPHHFVQMETSFGGKRVVDWLTGEQLPRIC